MSDPLTIPAANLTIRAIANMQDEVTRLREENAELRRHNATLTETLNETCVNVAKLQLLGRRPQVSTYGSSGTVDVRPTAQAEARLDRVKVVIAKYRTERHGYPVGAVCAAIEEALSAAEEG